VIKMTQETIVQTHNLKKVFEHGTSEIHALNEVNLTVKSNQIVSIMGVSGSGKSTLLHLIGGIDSPTDGTIISCCLSLNGLNEKELAKYRREKVGFVFQFENLSPILTAEENIELPLKILGMAREQRKRRVTELLTRMGMNSRATHAPHALSGGERQRIAVLVALANDAEIILADEPTGELDSENTQIIIDLFKQLKIEFGKTILLVTHNPVVARIGDIALEMRDGKIIGNAPLQQYATFCSDCSASNLTLVQYCSSCGHPLIPKA